MNSNGESPRTPLVEVRGVTVTFVAILELLREGLIEIVQSEAYAPLHVRLGNPARSLSLVADDNAANDDLARTQ